MITPKTKKLSQKKQYSTKDKNGELYQPLFDDEVFYQVPRIAFLYVSQYARFIRTYKRAVPRLLSPCYDIQSGYTTIAITIPKRANGKKVNRTSYGVHDLVAQVWCEYPNFLPKGVPTETHHKFKVKNKLNEQPIDINFAENLIVVYKRFHKLIDSIRSIKVATYGGNWKSVSSIEEIAEYYRIPLLDIYELLMGKSTYKTGKFLEYYETTINKKGIGIEVRKYATKTKQRKKK